MASRRMSPLPEVGHKDGEGRESGDRHHHRTSARSGSPQTAHPRLTDLYADLEELIKGPQSAPLRSGISGGGSGSAPSASRNLLKAPAADNLTPESLTTAPTYQTAIPVNKGVSDGPSVPSKPERPAMSQHSTLSTDIAKASPRTLAYVQEQRKLLQKRETPKLPSVLSPATAAKALPAGVNVHFVPSSTQQSSQQTSSQNNASTLPVDGPETHQHLCSKHEHHRRRHHHHHHDGQPHGHRCRHHRARDAQRNNRTSLLTLQRELSLRDKRFSSMVEHCLTDSVPKETSTTALPPSTARVVPHSENTLRKRAPKASRASVVDSIMGFEQMRPQDLVYGEGSKVDGGFGFALPSRYREGTILLDSGDGHHDSDCSPEDAECSRPGPLSAMYKTEAPGRGNGRQLAASSFLHRTDKPHSLADRISSANLRPSPLSINKAHSSRPMTPSRLRESSSIDVGNDETERGWEDVKLGEKRDRAESKNDRLAAALGISKAERHASQDGSESTFVGSDDQEQSVAKSHFNGSTYSSSLHHSVMQKREHHQSVDEVGPTHGMSQADIVAICLIQGMVPPGLPPDPGLVTWSTPLSPTNPRNWSPFDKWFVCILVSTATFLANAGTNMLAPALGLISLSFPEVYTPSVRGLLIGCYVLAFAFAPLIFGPMSEVLGRKPVLITGCTFFFAFTVASGFVTHSSQMMVVRFITALGASAPMSIGGSVITDIFPPEQRGAAMTVFALAPQLGPVLGPLLGGWISQEVGNWRFIFHIKAIAIFVCCVPLIFIKESYTPRILAKRADRLRKQTGDPSLSTIFERRRESVAQIFMRGSVRPLVLFASEPIIQMICLYVSVIYGVIHLLVATFPAVMGTVYAEYPGWASMHFIGVGIGTISGGITGGFLTELHYKRLTRQNGHIARPEFKLFSLLYMTWLAPLGLAGYFFNTYWGVHWIFADISIVLFCFSISAAVVSLQSYVVDCYSLLAGSALTSTIVVRSFFGFGATVAAEDLLLHGGLLWSGVALTALCIVTCVPVVCIVYFHGARMRSRSKYATHKR